MQETGAEGKGERSQFGRSTQVVDLRPKANNTLTLNFAQKEID
jgi:hypothetical protein